MTFSAGVAIVNVNIPITDDIEIEGNEKFTAVLSSPQPDVVIDNDAVATVTILDCDGELCMTQHKGESHDFYTCFCILLLYTECPPLDDIPDGSVTVSGFTTGATAIYSCNEGFELVGESTRVCGSDTTWSGEAPACSCKFKNSFALVLDLSIMLTLLQLVPIQLELQVWIYNYGTLACNATHTHTHTVFQAL